MLESRHFAQALSLRKILEYLCRHASEPDGPSVKEYELAVFALGRPESFDPKSDPIVRVNMAAVRGRLGAFFEDEGRDEPLRLTIPKGEYRAVFSVRDPNEAAPVSVVHKVLVVDDHAVVRMGLVALLSRQADLVVVGEAGSGREAVERYRHTNPDVVLMDVRMPDLPGPEAVRLLLAEHPNARVLMLSSFQGGDEIQRCLTAGARGYLLKSMAPSAIVDAIRSVQSGSSAVPTEVASELASNRSNLDDLERDVLQLIACGSDERAIAATLALSEADVVNAIARVVAKLKAKDRTEAVTLAIRSGAILLD